MKKSIPLGHSLTWIFVSAVVVNLLAFGGIKGVQFWKNRKKIDYKVPVRAIVQTGPQKEALSTAYLAELLDLSVDRPILSTEFDLTEAKQRLLDSPVIKEVEVKIKEPGILYIDYTTRAPVAFLADYENVALDLEGVPFPLTPFFTPKNLPEVYLGLEDPIHWNEPIQGESLTLAFDLLRIMAAPIMEDLFNVKRIDVSNAYMGSLGRREIVVITQEEIYKSYGEKEVCYLFPRMLRISTKKYAQELGNYLKLREELLSKEEKELKEPEGDVRRVVAPTKIIDFRIPQLAFIDERG